MSGRNARAGNCKKRDFGLGRVYCWKARAAFVCVCPMPRLLVPFGFGDLWPSRASWHVCVSALLSGKYTRALLGAVAGMRLVGETKSEGLKSSYEILLFLMNFIFFRRNKLIS